jgi:Protein of unknown function (DUF1638).
MKYKLIGCKLLERELACLSYRCPNLIDTTMMRQELHQTPALLRRELQAEIDLVDSNGDTHTNDASKNKIDAILLGFGLCSNAVLTLGSKKYPLVIPRAHDCITLCLGSKERYQSYFNTHPGTYYYTRGWVDLGLNPGDEQLEQKRLEYKEKFEDDDTVEYLMEIEAEMLKNYSNTAFISWDEIPSGDAAARTHNFAKEKGWSFDSLNGSDSVLRRLLWGEWNEDDFLIVPPGSHIAPSYDTNIVKAE